MNNSVDEKENDELTKINNSILEDDISTEHEVKDLDIMVHAKAFFANYISDGVLNSNNIQDRDRYENEFVFVENISLPFTFNYSTGYEYVSREHLLDDIYETIVKHLFHNTLNLLKVELDIGYDEFEVNDEEIMNAGYGFIFDEFLERYFHLTIS